MRKLNVIGKLLICSLAFVGTSCIHSRFDVRSLAATRSNYGASSANNNQIYRVQDGIDLHEATSIKSLMIPQNAEVVFKDGDKVLGKSAGSGKFKGYSTTEDSNSIITNIKPSDSTYYAWWEKSSVSLPSTQKTGYNFEGWQEPNSQLIWNSGSSYSFERFQQLNALFTPKSYNVYLDKYTTATLKFGKIPKNVSVPSTINKFKLQGEVYDVTSYFDGFWYDGVQYYDSTGKGCREWDIAESVTLKAHWKDDKLPNVTIAGYNFLGWSPDGTKKNIVHSDSDKYSELIAVLEPKSYTVKFGDKKQSVKFNDLLTDIGVPKKFGYNFCGYYLDNSGKECCIFDPNGKCVSKWLWAKSASLYAKWSKIDYNDSFGYTLAIGDKITLDLDDEIQRKVIENNKVSSNVTGSKVTIKAKRTGQCDVYVRAGGRTILIQVTVKKQPKSVTVSKKKITLGLFDEVKLKPVVSSGSYSKSFRYSSSNPSVVSVKQSGYIFGEKKGTATITITTSNNKKCKVHITVK